MKYILSILLSMKLLSGQAMEELGTISMPLQPADTSLNELSLNDTLDTLKCGHWAKGDYIIYIKLAPFLAMIEHEYASLLEAREKDKGTNPELLEIYDATIKRFSTAIHQLREGKEGFDLRQLVLYVGLDNSLRDAGHGIELELYVRSYVEKGNVAIYYKGQRIDTLKCRVVSDVVMSTINLYYDDDKNSLFQYYGYINW
jgi:hypothetical protein